jgi:hypothetical protein
LFFVCCCDSRKDGYGTGEVVVLFKSRPNERTIYPEIERFTAGDKPWNNRPAARAALSANFVVFLSVDGQTLP